MSRPIRARIDLAAFLANHAHARALAPASRVLAVIKANGYGHGAIALAQALAGSADGLAVACLEEALELRRAGIASPILLLEGPFEAAELPEIKRAGLGMVVHRREQVDWLLAGWADAPRDLWLKFDAGMHRLGFDRDGLRAAHAALHQALPGAAFTLMTHFSCADEPGSPVTGAQLARFAGACDALPGERSLANSAAIMTRPETHADWVRPGIMLYGASPLGDGQPGAADLRPVMQFESRLIAVRELAVGEPIGYGGRFTCTRPTRVGVVAAGYADGYPRHAPDGTPVAVCDRRTRLIGRVSMDMLTIDLTDLPGAGVGDRVELWGGRVGANEVAAAAGTIAYELFTGITRRVPLIYSDADAAEGG